MAIKEVQLRIKATADNRQAITALGAQSKVIRDQDRELKSVDRSQNKVIKDAKRGFDDLKRVAADMGRGIKSGFETALSGIEKFNKGIDGIAGKIVNLKTLIAGSVLGVAAYRGISSALTAGAEVKRLRERAQREFGTDAGTITAQGRRVAGLAGVSDEAALRAMISIGEVTQETQAGSVLRGRRLNAVQAAAARRQTTTFGANLLSRVATVTGIDAEEVAQTLAEAGSGPEGTRRLASLGVNRVFAREFSAANQKGQGIAFLRAHGQGAYADQLKAQGITSGVLGQGSVLEAILNQSGITEEAAAARRRTFGFQKQSIFAQLGNVGGEIGERALDRLTSGLGKGATLAERLQTFLASPKAQAGIDKIATSIERAVEWLIKAASEAPKFIGYLEQHKTAFAIGGGLLLGARVAGSQTARGIGGALAGLFKGGKVIADLAGTTKPIPVYVVNAPAGASGAPGISGARGLLGLAGKGGVAAGGLLAVAGAAAAYGGYKLGDYLGKHNKTVDAVHDAEANALYRLTGEAAADKKLEDFEVKRNRDQLARMKALKDARVKSLEAQGLTHGEAVNLAEHGQQGIDIHRTDQRGHDQTLHINLQLDGRTISQVVLPHITQHIKNQSAGGVAPGGRP